MKQIRTFIAIELPADIRRYLFQSGQQMSTDLPRGVVRWVAAENMHLTLRFLGDTAEDNLPEIAAQLDAITGQHQAFSLHLDQLGSYPNQKRPRIVWVGLGGELDTLNTLQSQIENAVQVMGWQREKRPFRPHLTLGRVKNPNLAHHLSWTQQLEKKEFLVSAVYLIESQLQRQGPVYTIRHSSKLI